MNNRFPWIIQVLCCFVLALMPTVSGVHAAEKQQENANDENEQSLQMTTTADGGLHFMPTEGLTQETLRAAALNDDEWAYDPTSSYDQKGLSQPRGFTNDAPTELIDPYSGNLVLRTTDFTLPGVAGLDLAIQRVYNSKIHRNYAAKARPDGRIAQGLLFHPVSPIGVGWTMHMGRLIGYDQDQANNRLQRPRYYERSDGSQHPYFLFSGEGCGNEQDDVCFTTKGHDNPYYDNANEVWRIATGSGLSIEFGHLTTDNNNPVAYATEIRDVYDNRIQIVYHDDTIPGIATPHLHYTHFVDQIIDSARSSPPIQQNRRPMWPLPMTIWATRR